MEDHCTTLLWTFLIVGLYSSSANSLLEMVPFLTADLFRVARVAKDSDRARVATLPEVFLSENF